MKKIILAVILTNLFFSFASKSEKIQMKKDFFRNNSAKIVESELKSKVALQKAAVDKFIESLSDEEKISQLFLVNIVGNEKFVPVEKFIPGGVILFSYNIASNPSDFKKFNDSIKKYCLEKKIIMPYLTLDQEGGSVNRLRSITSPLVSQKRISQEFSLENAYRLYNYQGMQMSALGLHLNLAPVSEVATSENIAFLDNRTFGDEEKTVSLSKACVFAYENAGVGAVLKHFPGNSATDPHTGLPKIETDSLNFEKNYLAPFKKILTSITDQSMTGIIMSHVRVSLSDGFSDEKTPAGLSKYWVTEVLRNKIGFTGLVISDDIFMGALNDNGFPPEKAAVEAVKAGVDVLMLSEKRFGKVALMLLEKAKSDEELKNKIEESVKRIINFKIKCGILKISFDNGNYSVAASDDFNEGWKKDFDEAYLKGKETSLLAKP